MSTEGPSKQDNESSTTKTSSLNTKSTKLSKPYAGSIRTKSLYTVSTRSLYTDSIASSQHSVSYQMPFIPNNKQREREDAFLGYYECLIPADDLDLSNPKISLSTARIDLHIEIKKNEASKEGKHLVLTKIKESPCFKNTSRSLFVITGKGKKKRGSYTGKKFNAFPVWMQDGTVEHLLDGEPIKGLGTYKVIIKKAMSTNNTNENNKINNKILDEWKVKSELKRDVNYKMALAGFLMKGNKGDYIQTKKRYLEAKNLYLKANGLGSIEAKLCLGYIYSIGLTKTKDYKPRRAKKLFKKVAEKTDNKMIAGIALRNIATLFHNEDIKPSILSNIIQKIENLSISGKKNESLHLKKAEKWYKQSCEKGDSQSAYILGFLYESNDGIKKDLNEAEYWFKKAVDNDNDNLYAKAKLGRILINKENVDENEKKKGIQLLKDAAEGELVMGQTYLGEFYKNEENYKEAIKFYSKAAMQNRGYYSHIAQHRLNKLDCDKNVENIENIEYIKECYKNEMKYGFIKSEESFENIR